MNFSSRRSFSATSLTPAHALSGWCLSACFWYAFLICESVAIQRRSSRPSSAYKSLRLSFFLDFLFSFLCFHCTLHRGKRVQGDAASPTEPLGNVCDSVLHTTAQIGRAPPQARAAQRLSAKRLDRCRRALRSGLGEGPHPSLLLSSSWLR